MFRRASQRIGKRPQVFIEPWALSSPGLFLWGWSYRVEPKIEIIHWLAEGTGFTSGYRNAAPRPSSTLCQPGATRKGILKSAQSNSGCSQRNINNYRVMGPCSKSRVTSVDATSVVTGSNPGSLGSILTVTKHGLWQQGGDLLRYL